LSAASRALQAATALAMLSVLALWPPVHALDQALQAAFYDAARAAWLVPPEARGLAWWLGYRGPKLALVALGLAAFGWLACRAALGLWEGRDRRLLAGLCVAVAIPLLAGVLKDATAVSCPVQELAYGGAHAPVALWQRLAGQVPFDPGLRCWPAGHAAGGFALLGCRLLVPADRAGRWRLWLPGMAAGWGLGIYQMARGQHYLSHTLATMALAVLLSSLALLAGAAWRRPLRLP